MRDMKKTILGLTCLMTAIFPDVSAAQKNIQSAFDAIIDCKEATIAESHILNRDPQTGAKTGQCDVWKFILPADKSKLVNNAVKAFSKDSDTAYSLNSGFTSDSPERLVMLSVGGESNGEYITEKGYDYTYSLYLAPKSEDPEGIYRYAYGINYREDGGKISGKLVVTYSTTLKYRQAQEEQRTQELFNNYTGNSTFNWRPQAETKSWFGTLMGYLQSMSTADTQTRISLATKAYEHIQAIKGYPVVSLEDKNTARVVLKNMLSERKYYSDPMVNSLLNSCLTSLINK